MIIEMRTYKTKPAVALTSSRYSAPGPLQHTSRSA